MLTRNKNSGFTLLELLVVISIIGLMSSVILVSINSARGRSRDAQRVGNIDAIIAGVNVYTLSNDYMPLASSTNIGITDLSNPQWQQLGDAIGIARMPRGALPNIYAYFAAYQTAFYWPIPSTSDCVFMPRYSSMALVQLESHEFLSQNLGIAPDSAYYIRGAGDTYIGPCGP